jgi:hypothetical protein
VQNGSLKKGITAYAGGGYATSTESSVTVQRNVNAAAGAIFSYYDGSYAGLTAQTPLSSPVNVTQVKFVKISLPIYNTAGKSNANYFTMSAGAALRGLKTNLGE